MSDVEKIAESLKVSHIGGDLEGAASVFFIGIGGIGMSALARYFNYKGFKVSGYDKTETTLTKQLVAEGINIHYEDNLQFIDKQAKFVVYTPAVPKHHVELNYYRDNNYLVVKRSDVLGAITASSFNVCVAGTHGKTTTSTMVAHILRDSGYGCNAFLGGVAVNYNSNFWSSEKNVSVAEADEYDRSFLKLSPDVAIITAMDPDHLDIYGTEEAVQQAFIDFSARLKPGGLLIYKFGLEKGSRLNGDNKLSYHLNDTNADVHTANIKMNNGSYEFDVQIKDKKITGVVLNMGGMHNIENVIAAITVADQLGIDEEKIKKAVSSFKGVKRRFEYVIKNEGAVMIDDYAHHPEELRALITGAKDLFHGRKCTVIFQPHLYSRTRDFADGFAETLSLADEVVLLPIYPARELPIEGVTSEMILSKMQNQHKQVLSKEDLLAYIESLKASSFGGALEEANLIITAGAGDIDTLVEPIKEILTK